MAPLHGPGQGLKADVVGAAIPAEGDELDLPLNLPLPLQGIIGRLHPGQGGAGALKGRMDVAVLIGGVGIEEGADLQAAGGVAHHRPVLLPQGPQNAPDRNARPAAGAEAVSPHKAFFFLQGLFEMIGSLCVFHGRLPPLSQM